MSTEQTALHDVLSRVTGAAETLLDTVEVPAAVRAEAAATRAVVAEALALVLLGGLLARVPAGRAYVDEQRRAGRRIVFDHGALRTVAAPSGSLPAGRAAFGRLLAPLGYARAAVYPLDRIGMTGHAYRQADFPEGLPQYFVSEFYPERFSPPFQAAVARVVGQSRDPLGPEAAEHLAVLARTGRLSRPAAATLVDALAGCFDRQHEVPFEADYDTLLAESAEMAWIATEGNAFNHATDRVSDLDALVEAQRRLGRPLKERTEVSSSGRLRQTAFRAQSVERLFRRPDGTRVMRTVPGSFFEFICRDVDPALGGLDLGFDSANAQGIFRMTAPRP